jgi:DNA-binding winged helix-turn-helix (wHTH) protein
MATGSFRFDRFHLDSSDRQLKRDDVPVELNARYLDALVLLVREQGRLVSKDRFLDEVWRGIPVTDEALTQCIRTLRRQLGDEAANPRFIETVPKHGYRFIAPVQSLDGEPVARIEASADAEPRPAWGQVAQLGGAATIGGALAGMIGGIFYGFLGASQPLASGPGATSVLAVLVALTAILAMVGAAGVGFGIAVASVASGRVGPWNIVGGAVGGLIIGAFVKLLGLDAFNLLFGQAPADFTGAAEGVLLGAAVGLGAWLANRGDQALKLRRAMPIAGLSGGAAGILIAILGGKLMGGSLDLLARSFPQSRLRLDPIGALLGESGFGPVSQIVTGGLEGALFASCVVGAMAFARRKLA